MVYTENGLVGVAVAAAVTTNDFDCLEEEGSKKGHAPHVSTTTK